VTRARTTAALVGLVALVVVIIGGYALHWKWTGLNGHTATLWDWLNLILLPAAFIGIPIWLSAWRGMRPRHVAAGTVAFAVFAGLVLLGYLVPLPWTGFTGNTLWDWLQLVLLPAAIATWPVWVEKRARLPRRWVALAWVLLVALAFAIVGGYAFDWAWTGFPGKTLWDWLHLVVLPFVSVAFLPTIVGLASRGLLAEAEAETAHGDSAGGSGRGFEIRT
jgi:hypothetical protein